MTEGTELEFAVIKIAKEIGDIKDILAAAFPPADKRPLAERLAEVTEGVIASFEEAQNRTIKKNIEF